MSRRSGDHRARNVEVVGYSDLDGRPGFKMAIQRAGGRWYLYVTHAWHSGWSILDVTEPAAPRVARFLEGPANTWTLQIQVADGRMVTALEKIAPGWGGDPGLPNEEGVLIRDVSDPVAPRRLGHFRTGGSGTHRTYFNAGLRVFDISDPRLPREVGYFVPPDPVIRRGLPPTALVAQSEDVVVDARGYAYVTDKNHGLYVPRYQP